MNKELVKHLISINKDLVISTALRNCHVKGLNSFIINEKPRIRLFIAEKNCKLYEEFNYDYPVIPIHPHKYDDFFFTLQGTVKHFIFETTMSTNAIYSRKYLYSRISDDKCSTYLGPQYLKLVKVKNNPTFLKAQELHTVQIYGRKCSWVIIEGKEDVNFKPIGYRLNMVPNPLLYEKFENPIEYLNEYFK